MKGNKSHDPWSAVVIFVTFGLFVFAIFLKGLKHDVLLEAGVFLVSLKLILLARGNAQTEKRLEQRLIEIQNTLTRASSYGASDRAS
jgi:succinate-acetate transporter protein